MNLNPLSRFFPFGFVLLLLYSFEKLASALIQARISGAPVIRNHGVEFKEGKIKIRQKGLFRYFHSCYYKDNSICDNGEVFTMENLIISDLPTKINDINGILLREKDDFLLIKVKSEITNQRATLHELDRELLFVFALASISRYNTIQWSRLIEGKQTDLIIEVQRYLRSVETFFPLIIASYLYDTKFVPEFYPATVTEFK